ncbi:thiol:disulfide interchange protein DsbA [Luteibacter sp. Sphag1AF]|uniref:thiol:disulfide interchange protein DsbA/DsbL n=1 Tax=Luteibacter sp. Sphag1AF TaxID=2587031 RepID=UPI0016086566|nr:thiol:disulfide interchange protein DsbA/DsbL [Luteibacter sp. Sphag1AF]MBB3226210.1 thiol:disulfide interchange protein DsbA [Luteibacter sp. Sphag1AF]
MFQRLALLVCGALLATACTAGPADNSGAAAAAYAQDTNYVAIKAPERAGKQGKVEVVEVFSYGCIHCAHYEQSAEALQKSLPAGVTFRAIPAAFNDAWLPYAQAFYAAKKLGVLEKTHAALFKAKFNDNYPLHTLEELAAWYHTQAGVDQAAFLREANSDATKAQILADTRLIQAWGVDGTPSIVVDGKYRATNFKDWDDLNALTLFLVKKELAGGK